ncbi:MAG: YihY/virulence factor BrkB family protein [bacterium]|nr:YihY/virulence factor BrkB family protein [bacterium]
MIRFVLFVHRTWKKYTKDEITVYAAQAAFFTLLAAVPFLMVLISAIQMVPGLSKMDLEESMMSIVPEMFHSLLFAITDDLFTRSPATILSITAITAIWSASRSMFGIEKGLNRIWGDHVSRSYLLSRLICTGYTFVFILMFVMMLGFSVFGGIIGNFLIARFPYIGKAALMLINFRMLITFFFMFLFFWNLYTCLPRRKLDWKSQIPGAFFSSVSWSAFSFAFSIYFENFSNYSYIYGSLTAIILLTLWLYFCLCILFIGAEINCVLSTTQREP